MKKIFLGALFICSALLSCTSPEMPTAKYQVVPLPQEIIEEAGDGFVLDNSTCIVYSGDAEMKRNAELLAEYPVDIVVMGIGENGHIAFNDPPVADFADPKAVKPVELDPICRNQQVNDGCFARLEDVPRTAITLTVPTLFAGKHLFCIVPAKSKANAVRATIHHQIGEICPATVLRRHKSAVLYLDADSSALL